MPPPQADNPAKIIARQISNPAARITLRRSLEIPINKRQPSIVIAAAILNCRAGKIRAPCVAAVVETVSVAVPELVPVMLTGLVVPKPKVGKSCAPLGLVQIK